MKLLELNDEEVTSLQMALVLLEAAVVETGSKDGLQACHGLMHKLNMYSGQEVKK